MKRNVIWLIISLGLMAMFYWKGTFDEEKGWNLLCRGDYMVTGMWFTNAVLNFTALLGGLA